MCPLYDAIRRTHGHFCDIPAKNTEAECHHGESLNTFKLKDFLQ